MFEDLRAAFREAIDNFNQELSRDRVPETMDKLLRGMKGEIASARALVKDLESQIERAKAQTEAEAAAAATARRRAEMAQEIGDEETAQVAATYAEKHGKRETLLRQKAQALAEELEFRKRDEAEMFAKFHEAEAKRGELETTTGRTQARGSIDAADDLFAELNRMADIIDGEEAQRDAAVEVDGLDLGDDSSSDYHVEIDSSPPEEPDLDSALAELKRRMGHE